MKHIYTKLLCSLALGTACVLGASAEGKKAVVVISNDGNQRQELLEDIDRIEIGATALTIKNVGGASETVDYTDIDRIMIGAEWTAVQRVTAPGEIAVWPTATTGIVNISGLEAGTAVTVFDIKGAVAANAVATGEITSLNLGQLPAGVYVVTAANQSVKIIKK